VTSWSTSSGGYLDAEPLSFLLASQFAARAEPPRSCLKHLEPNQAAYVKHYFESLSSQRTHLLEQLSIPQGTWPEPPDLTQFTSPLDSSTFDISIVEHPSIHELELRANEGRLQGS
jgi:hypothetical protein